MSNNLPTFKTHALETHQSQLDGCDRWTGQNLAFTEVFGQLEYLVPSTKRERGTLTPKHRSWEWKERTKSQNETSAAGPPSSKYGKERRVLEQVRRPESYIRNPTLRSGSTQQGRIYRAGDQSRSRDSGFSSPTPLTLKTARWLDRAPHPTLNVSRVIKIETRRQSRISKRSQQLGRWFRPLSTGNY